MSGVAAPSRLANLSVWADSVGAGRIDSDRSPSIANRRPVACSAMRAISGL